MPFAHRNQPAAVEARDLVAAAWTRACQSVAPHPVDALAAILRPVLQAYDQQHRHYHGIFHLAACVREFDSVRELFRRPDAGCVALIFHDSVYDPARHDNEERSAEWAERVLSGMATPSSLITTVSQLILSTAHRGVPADPDAQLVCDIDLAILGQPEEAFDAYEWAIRLEYGHVPIDAFVAGRARVIRHFLARPTVYATAAFRDRYEQAARRNLERSLARLEGSAAG